jgi:hypothetical protein
MLPQGLVIAARLDARDLAFEIEVADFAEVEEARVVLRPLVHPAAMHVVRQVIDVGEPVPRRILRRAGNRLEVDVVDADVADLAGRGTVLAAPAVDEIDHRVADALDRGMLSSPGPPVES